MKRFAVIISPVVFVLFTACGGGDDAPPPLASNPQTTPDIKCADMRLTDALNKCKSGIGQNLPLLLASTNNNGNGNGGINPALLAAILSNNNSQQPPPPPQLDPKGCPVPQTDNTTSCRDDLLTALLLWKSAPKADGSLAINDAFYRRYLFLKIKDYLNVAAAQMQLSPDQANRLKAVLAQAALTGVIDKSGLSGSDANLLTNLLNGGTLPPPTNAITYANGQLPPARPLILPPHPVFPPPPHPPVFLGGHWATQGEHPVVHHGPGHGFTSEQTIDRDELKKAKGYGLVVQHNNGTLDR